MFDNKYLILFLSLFFTFILCGTVSAASDTLTSDQQAMMMNTQIPFVENIQTDSSVKYCANTLYGTAYVSDDGIYHCIIGENTTMVVKEEFLDEQGQVITFQPTGTEKGTAKVDFYIGNDSSKWVTSQSTWNVISLGEIYPGINVLLKAHGGNVEKIFQIEPGASPDAIKIRAIGADSINIDVDGNLNLQSSAGDVQLSKPTAYQDDEKIETNYTLNDNIYGFQTTPYNTTKTLTIDPILKYSTYLGGKTEDSGNAITIDNNGNIYITGSTYALFYYNFPTTPGAYKTTLGLDDLDVIVSKIAPNGNGTADLLYSTIIGGNASDFGSDIVVDEDGNIYITGMTYFIELPDYTSFPTTSGAYQTNGSNGYNYAIVVKLTPNGNGSADLVYSTLLGGTANTGLNYCQGYGIDIDSSRNIYITGLILCFPATTGAYQNTNNGGFDAFIAEIAPNGNGTSDLLYCTLIGGSNNDEGRDIVVDDSGKVFIAGNTNSTDFPTYAKNPLGPYRTTNFGSIDSFVCELMLKGNGAADLLYSTYIGGNGNDCVEGIALDNYGYIYITGITSSSNFPTTSKAYQASNHGDFDVFVTKIADNGWGETDLRYSTYLGGTSKDNAVDIALDSSDNIYITGATASTDFPVTPGTVVTNHDDLDVYITKLVPISYDTYRLGYTTFIGGSSTEESHGIAVDNNGNIYITGYTTSNDFPTTSGAYQTIYGMGVDDAFICKFSEVNMVYKGDPTMQGPFDISHIIELIKLIANEILNLFRGIGPLK